MIQIQNLDISGLILQFKSVALVRFEWGSTKRSMVIPPPHWEGVITKALYTYLFKPNAPTPGLALAVRQQVLGKMFLVPPLVSTRTTSYGSPFWSNQFHLYSSMR